MKGKNFSTNNSSGKRRKADFYETPYSLTQQFLDEYHKHIEDIPEDTNILEPCCGDGAIVRVLERNRFSNVGYYDLDKNGIDFLNQKGNFDWIITNPPFSKALDFIKKAKEVSNNFAFLLPLSYLHGKRRYDEVYTDLNYPLYKVFVFTRYPMLGEPLREDGKYHTGMMVYAWFVWKKGYRGLSTISWIDNNEYVLNKGDTN